MKPKITKKEDLEIKATKAVLRIDDTVKNVENLLRDMCMKMCYLIKNKGKDYTITNGFSGNHTYYGNKHRYQNWKTKKMVEETEHQSNEELLQRIKRLENMIEENEIEKQIEKAEEIRRKERNGYDWPPID